MTLCTQPCTPQRRHGVIQEPHYAMNFAGVPGQSAFVQPTPSQSWRALTVMVAQAIISCCPRGIGRMHSESRPSAFERSSSVDAARTDRSVVNDLSNDRPAPQLPPSDNAPDEPSDPDEIEADHAETWALVQAVQRGDGDAFGQLYDRYVNQIFRFIYYRVNDRQLAEDFTSETFLRALRRISTINYQGRDIGAWFMTIARNIVFDHTKSARFRLEITTDDAIEPSETIAGPEAAVLAHLTNARLMGAVNNLNDEQKECIVLRFLQGLSVAETAAVMGKNDGAIKALQHRAVKRLASMLADELR